jgi:hypothetical protein
MLIAEIEDGRFIFDFDKRHVLNKLCVVEDAKS